MGTHLEIVDQERIDEVPVPLGMMDRLAVRPGGVVANTLADRSAENLSLVGRFNAGFSLAKIKAPLQVLSDRLATAYPKENGGHQLLAARIARLGYSNGPDRGPGGRQLDRCRRLRPRTLRWSRPRASLARALRRRLLLRRPRARQPSRSRRDKRR